MSEWAAYGFPNPLFRPCRLPMEGLWKALAERHLPFEGRSLLRDFAFPEGWCIDAITAHAFIPLLAKVESDDFTGLDGAIRHICGGYINHTRDDFAAWAWDDLCAAAAPDGLAEPPGRLAPKFPAEWAIQRYRMLNLLKYPLVKAARPDWSNGSTHTGRPSSMAESVADAVAQMEESVSSDGRITNFVQGIYGPDHGWREGSYCCNIFESANIRLPEKFTSLASKTYAVLDVTSPSGDDADFDDMGFESIRLGRCVVPFSSDGTALKRELPYMPSIPATPVPGRETYIGWMTSSSSMATLDVSPLFKFYDDMGEDDLLKALL